jgi:hypothetical protein
MRPAILAAALLAACAADPPRQAPDPFWHASAGPEQWERDRWECVRDASAAAPPSQRFSSSGGYMVSGVWIPPRVESYDDSLDQRVALTRLCLQARGWRQSPTDPWAAQRAPGTRFRPS